MRIFKATKRNQEEKTSEGVNRSDRMSLPESFYKMMIGEDPASISEDISQLAHKSA